MSIIKKNLEKAKYEVYDRISTVTGPKVNYLDFVIVSGQGDFDDIVIQYDLTVNQANELREFAYNIKPEISNG